MSEHVSQSARRRILPLPAEVVERIAAGEVIERPASVVRELIENALDAGATTIRVSVREGGLRAITVSDDGVGIAADDLAAACAPHATSKIGALDDLAHITTLGFRGEALASMAAVATLELVSADDESGMAHSLTIAGGARSEGAVPRARGTTVTVRDLFAQVPARQALLQRPRTEAQRIMAVVRAYALAHPQVAFSLTTDGYLVLQTPGGADDPHGAVAALFGADVAAALVPLTAITMSDGTMLGGVIAARAFHFATRQQVVVAVNGRPIRNGALLAAAEAGYRPLLRKGRHPLLWLWLHVEPGQMDANIHPAKAEVLLSGESTLAAVIRDTVHEALARAPVSAQAIHAATARVTGPRFARPLQLQFPAQRQRRGLRLPAPARIAAGGTDADDGEDAAAIEGDWPLEPLGQFDNTLILARSAANALYLVDQHRAHERILYDELVRQRAALRVTPSAADEAEAMAHPGQMLLEPLMVELTAGQAALLLPRLHELRALGLDCEPFGGSVFLVRSVPQLPHLPGALGEVGVLSDPTALAGLARELPEDAAEDSDAWLDHVCARIACRSAIRRGQALALEEQRALLADLARVPTVATCPHGSPLLLRYTHRALARTFEW